MCFLEVSRRLQNRRPTQNVNKESYIFPPARIESVTQKYGSNYLDISADLKIALLRAAGFLHCAARPLAIERRPGDPALSLRLNGLLKHDPSRSISICAGHAFCCDGCETPSCARTEAAAADRTGHVVQMDSAHTTQGNPGT